MNTKTYDTITVRKEKDSVIFTNPEQCFPMKRSTFMQIVADNVKGVMKPDTEPDNITITYDTSIPWD